MSSRRRAESSTRRGADCRRGRKQTEALRLALAGARDAEPKALGRLPGEVNYLVGDDSSKNGHRARGADRLRLAGNGDLVVETGEATVRQRAPSAYQRIAGERRPVEASFAVHGRTVGFHLGAYDDSRPLTIDPVPGLRDGLRDSPTTPDGQASRALRI